MIPRYQRILFGILLGSSVLMAIYLFHLHHKRMEELAALSDPTPLSAPDNTDAESVTLAIANDADASITVTPELVALPAEPGARARALLERLLSGYALPNSTHPLTGGQSVDDVFLLPVDVPKTPAAASSPLFTAAEPSETQQMLAVINLHGGFVQGHPSGVLTEMLTVQSILQTLHANLPQITQVRFLVDGQQVATLAGHADLSRTYSMADLSTPTPADPTTPPADDNQ
ncbi:MAG: GerMN domain-containing protein [Acidobacteriaceae bacterium]|nr:GerMN domain-containing protein [Acidobacteriaceae bacterium]